MNEGINCVTSEMEKTADDVRASFGFLSGEQLNWKPSEKSWSVGQCLEHIIKTNEMFRNDFDKLASGSRRNSLWETWSPFTVFNGRFLIKSVTVDSKKSKVPSKAIIPPSEIGPDIVERFCEHVAGVNELLDKCAGADLKKTVMSSPFLSVFTYTLDDAYTVLVEHTKRHIRQAKRVMTTDGFPASEAAATVGRE
jgi:hypothetical protein